MTKNIPLPHGKLRAWKQMGYGMSLSWVCHQHCKTPGSRSYDLCLLVNDVFHPITRRQISDSSKLKEFADDNFKFYENRRKLSKPVENTVGKGEIARYEQFLLFPQCFQKACFPGASKSVIVWEWVTLSKEEKPLKILWGKKHFLLSPPQCFLLFIFVNKSHYLTHI